MAVLKYSDGYECNRNNESEAKAEASENESDNNDSGINDPV